MTPKARARAVRGAFALSPGHELKGCAVLLIDDVHTSGATAAACARALKRGGAASVHLLCWARVLPDGDRKRVVEGKSVSVRVDRGGSRIIKKKKDRSTKYKQPSNANLDQNQRSRQ